MDINVTCEKHNVSMVVVREWSYRGNIEVTVEPCIECIEEFTKTSNQSQTKEMSTCEGCGAEIVDGKVYAHFYPCPAKKQEIHNR